MHIIELSTKGAKVGYAFVVVASLDRERAVELLQRADVEGLFDVRSFEADDIEVVRKHILLNQRNEVNRGGAKP